MKAIRVMIIIDILERHQGLLDKWMHVSCPLLGLELVISCDMVYRGRAAARQRV